VAAPRKAEFLGIGISVVDLPELLAVLMDRAASATRTLVNNVNVHALNLAARQPEFADILNRSEVVFCDGFGVKLGAKLVGLTLGQRMTPPDWIDAFFEQCRARGFSVYMLGDRQAVVDAVAKEAQRRFPGLKIAGRRSGYFDMEGPENARIVAEIAGADPDFILTGMGMPRQEVWADRSLPRLKRGVVIATGALFRWYTGVEQRAPKWMTDNGLEWLARLARRPRQHFHRYVTGNTVFLLRTMRYALRRRRQDPRT